MPPYAAAVVVVCLSYGSAARSPIHTSPHCRQKSEELLRALVTHQPLLVVPRVKPSPHPTESLRTPAVRTTPAELEEPLRLVLEPVATTPTDGQRPDPQEQPQDVSLPLHAVPSEAINDSAAARAGRGGPLPEVQTGCALCMPLRPRHPQVA